MRDKESGLYSSNLRDCLVQIIDLQSEDRKNQDFKRVWVPSLQEDGEGKMELVGPGSVLVITIIGVDEHGNTIAIEATNFKPFFFIELPRILSTSSAIQDLLNDLAQLLPFHCRNELVREECTQEQRFKFKGYQWNRPRNFLLLTFHSHRACRALARILEKEVALPSNPFDDAYIASWKLPLFESNVDPVLRFIHRQSLNPSGWIRVRAEKYKRIRQNVTHCLNAISTVYKHVLPEPLRETIGPLLVASYDIEADSSHGDFPVARKDYAKTAKEIMDVIRSQLTTERTAIRLAPVQEFLESCFSDGGSPFHVYIKANKTRPTAAQLLDVSQRIIKKAIDLEVRGGSEWKKTKDRFFRHILKICNSKLPAVEGDKVIQIGTVFFRYGEKEPLLKHIVTLGTCSPVEGVVVQSFETEHDLLLGWQELIRSTCPEVIIGYNIFGFDYRFIYDRCEEVGCASQFKELSKMRGRKSELIEKKLSSSGLGDNLLYYPDMSGCVQIDLLKVVQRDHKLVSYKLDNVAGTFIHGKIKTLSFSQEGDRTRAVTDNVYGLNPGDFVHLCTLGTVGEEGIEDNKKYRLLAVDPEGFWIEGPVRPPKDVIVSQLRWGLSKDDIAPNDIFRLQKGSAEDRAIIAKYCIQDCALVLQLLLKLDILPSNMGMSKVCFVPLQYLFLRGQGIKTYSLMLYECGASGYIIPYEPKEREADEEEDEGDDSASESDDDVAASTTERGEWWERRKAVPLTTTTTTNPLIEKVREGYEGAIVLPPKPRIYLEEPIAVLDYASLYPSSMISENLSHDTIILEEEFMGQEGAERLRALGIEYRDVPYDNYLYFMRGTQTRKEINREKPIVICRYVQPRVSPDGKIDDKDRGIVPRILVKLLRARKNTRKMLANEADPFKRSVLDGLQQAYKVTANSIYGSIGAPTNPINFKDIAASTTAVGRIMLYLAKDFVEKNFPGAEAVYGDTDSIFINFNPKDPVTGLLLKGEAALVRSIELGKEAGRLIKPLLRPPHDLEYEKTFWPFILFSKKRYVGNKYEDDPRKFKLSSMGIVLKRRDNAPLLKHIYAAVIDTILNEKDIGASVQGLKADLRKVLKGGFPLEYLIISKSLKSRYENPEQIVHKALADRIGERDPGNKPQPNDRIPYVYIDTPKKVSLQGDRVEHPDFIRKHGLKPDYVFYITNQIMKPVSKIYSLILEQLDGFTKGKDFYEKRFQDLLREKKGDQEKARKKWEEERMKEVQDLIFEPILRAPVRVQKNRREGNCEISRWFKSV